MAKVIPLRRPDGGSASLSDEALLAACGTGDPAALAALFDRHVDAIARFLSRLAGTDARDVDDLVQLTFVELSRSARSFRGATSVRAWLFGIATNVARHHVRSEIRRKSHVNAIAAVEPPEAARPDRESERRELLRRVGEAIHDLPLDLRTAFVLCELEELSGPEAARVLDVKEGTLWRRLHEARKALRAALEGTPP